MAPAGSVTHVLYADDVVQEAQRSIRIARVLVVVISGPIASGKSALSRVVAAQLEEAEVATAVIDLDLVYEMLDPRRGTKDNADLWAEARRVAGRLTTALLAENRCVVAEGQFASDQALDEFVGELPGTTDLRLVLLDVDFETALKRVSADATRGLSKDETFLSRHYREFRPEWVGHDVLRLDTTESTLGEAARAVVDWLTPAA